MTGTRKKPLTSPASTPFLETPVGPAQHAQQRSSWPHDLLSAPSSATSFSMPSSSAALLPTRTDLDDQTQPSSFPPLGVQWASPFDTVQIDFGSAEGFIPWLGAQENFAGQTGLPLDWNSISWANLLDPMSAHSVPQGLAEAAVDERPVEIAHFFTVAEQERL